MQSAPTVARAVAAGVISAAMVGMPCVAHAQQTGSTIQVAAGAVGSIGEYLRVGGDLGGGILGGDGRGTRLGARADAYGRFHVDPLAQSRWAPYLVAGGSLRTDERSRGRLYVLAALGVEGPASHHVVPAFELGLGGGVRFSVALRRAFENHR